MPANKYSGNLHLGSKGLVHEHARQLRHMQTEAEQKLWALLRNNKLRGKKFRRQHALANYVVDFYCHECKLAIELDGNHHKEQTTKEYDEGRTKTLSEQGIQVLRFWNREVMDEIDQVIYRIEEYIGR